MAKLQLLREVTTLLKSAGLEVQSRAAAAIGLLDDATCQGYLEYPDELRKATLLRLGGVWPMQLLALLL